MEQLFNRQYLHIAMLLWGTVFSIIAALCMFLSKSFEKRQRRYMILLELSAALLLGSDAVAWAFRGYAGKLGYVTVRVSNFLVFVMSDVVLFFFHRYLCSCLFPQKEEKKIHRIKIVELLCMAGIFLVAVSQFTNLYYYFDANNFYHRNTWYIISELIPLSAMFLDLSLIIQYRDRLSKRMFISLSSYICLPVVAACIQIFYYGISLINIAVGISVILMLVIATAEQSQSLTEKEKEAADLRISMMLSQIAPHFIYNTLTAIRALCRTDPEMARQTIDEFAKYLRGNINSLSEKGNIPFTKELEHVQCYLSIEKKRFADCVRVRYDIQEENFRIPPLTLQPIVENAVKHGICKKPEGGTVWIHTERTPQGIRIVVSDDGAGFDRNRQADDGKVHIGLKNVQKRLKEMCGGTLEITSAVGEGTTVVITLPQKGQDKKNEDISSR